ncbi:methyltransferase domain-containing protein [Brucepastera parasyntrophica]|uniref:bifunctional glycosyltransferase/class I SAM-dependent methyltransferase n=1 Tax=Brucepastera parasyntrophica TaxID=2880008 RepID=UPI003F7047F5
MVIRQTGADIVVRATGDNPYVFADAAQAALLRFTELRDTRPAPDYFAYSGLPHGSGVEIISAARLLEASALTDSLYDHEHVAPALYLYPERYNCVREEAPLQWFYPDIRTTIDTRTDYEQAKEVALYLSSHGQTLPALSSSIIEACQYITQTLLFVPSAVTGQGSGHLIRTLDIVSKLSGKYRCIIYLPENHILPVPENFRNIIVSELPVSAALVILDRFRSSIDEIKTFRGIGPVVAFDEGGPGRPYADYLFDIIPAIPYKSFIRKLPANRTDPSFLALPEKKQHRANHEIKTALVSGGGEDAAGLARSAAHIMRKLGFEVTVIDPSIKQKEEDNQVTALPFIRNLKETLYTFDLVVTHFGLTAFEALAAGCRVILFSPTRYHYRLAKYHGFSVIPPGRMTAGTIKKILKKDIKIPSVITPETVSRDIADSIPGYLDSSVSDCPLCGNAGGRVIARLEDRSIALCPECGMEYLYFIIAAPASYSHAYFFEEYSRQYGKTYLEDFEFIKEMGVSRIKKIEKIFARRSTGRRSNLKTLLDIGCAYGPFLSAAYDSGWDVTGIDISEDAVRHVKENLGFAASISAFPDTGIQTFSEKSCFSVITLWYVIEHFKNLEPVFTRIRELLCSGGILAFSTPSASGISALKNRSGFFKNSPSDHFTLWRPGHVRKQLSRYGFDVEKIISTGHHPERFPGLRGVKKNSLIWKACMAVSRVFFLGDTFEVYAVKKEGQGKNT